MNKRENIDLNARFLNRAGACQVLQIGRSTLEKLAKEAGARREITSRCVRYDMPVIFDYMESKESGNASGNDQPA